MDHELCAHVAYLPEIGESARCNMAEGEGLFRGTREGGVRSQGLRQVIGLWHPTAPTNFGDFCMAVWRPQADIIT